ncbi:glycosyltransferase family 25 protein [Neptunicoccus sediminis]|uniref:glycosyltransferase family 25 protein n=1 Tax=Neptunicoccus sediminis TaxID=1892596 RepID=UPI0008460808|nr:glycosyltransferase family 25 protein [Neptunicoccus sediminis]
MAERIETLIIHLARATGRRGQVDRLLSDTPYPARVIDAVEGSVLSAEQQDRVLADHPLFKPRYPFPLNAGELGCFLSHRTVWQMIVDQGLSAALVLEDDVALVDGFDRAATFAAQHVNTLGYIQFQVRPVPECKTVARGENVSIVQPKVTPLRTSAQMVSNAAAVRLLALTKQVDRPVDTFLQSHWHTGLQLACVVPSGVEDRTAQSGGSTISTRKPIAEKMKREWMRARYRAAVKGRSRNG